MTWPIAPVSELTPRHGHHLSIETVQLSAVTLRRSEPVTQSQCTTASRGCLPFYQASSPMSATSDIDAEFSLALGETSVNTGGFAFDPSLDFFGKGRQTSSVNEK